MPVVQGGVARGLNVMHHFAAYEAMLESLLGPTYPNVPAGLAATDPGQSFAVDNGAGTVTIYLNDGGSAVAQRTLATTAALSAAGAAMLGFEQDSPDAVLRTVEDRLHDTISVKDFGAIGNDLANDRLAIAVAEAFAYARGKSLFFPAGIYRFSSRLPIRVDCYGEGEASVLKATGATIDDTITNEHPVTGPASDITFTGLCFDGNNKARGTHFVGGSRVTVQDCFVRNCLVGGITFYLMQSPKAINNRITDTTYDAALTAADGIFVGDCAFAVIEGNSIARFERIGIVVDSIGAGGSIFPRVANNDISGASNCDDSVGEYNAGIWFEVTNGGVIIGNHVSDIAGDPETRGQTSGRVLGITVHAVGDTREALVLCTGNTVELGDISNQAYPAYNAAGSGQRANIVFHGNIARFCGKGLGVVGGMNSLDVRGFAVDHITRVNNSDGAIIVALERTVNKLTIDDLTVTNATDSVGSDDWGDVHFASTTAGATISVFTIRNVHGVHMMMTPNSGACARLHIEHSSLYYGAASNLYCLSAMHVTAAHSTFLYSSRGFAGLMNQNIIDGATSRWFLTACLFIGGDQVISGADGIRAFWNSCDFQGSSIRFGLSENVDRLLKFEGCSFNEYSATEGAIKGNYENTNTGLRLIVQNCDFNRSTNVPPIRLWSAQPGTVILSNNVHSSTALTDMAPTSATNNVVG